MTRRLEIVDVRGDGRWAHTFEHDIQVHVAGEHILVQQLEYSSVGLRLYALDLRTGSVLWTLPRTRSLTDSKATSDALFFTNSNTAPHRLDARTGVVEPLPDHWSCFDVDERGRAFGCARSGGEIWSEEGPTGVHLPVSYGFNAVRGGFVFSGNTGIPHRYTTSLETGVTVRHEIEDVWEWVMASGALIARVSSGSERYAVALDPGTGEELWRTHLKRRGIREYGRLVLLRGLGLVDARTRSVRFQPPYGHEIVCADEHHVVVNSLDSTDVYALI